MIYDRIALQRLLDTPAELVLSDLTINYAGATLAMLVNNVNIHIINSIMLALLITSHHTVSIVDNDALLGAMIGSVDQFIWVNHQLPEYMRTLVNYQDEIEFISDSQHAIVLTTCLSIS